MPVVKIRPYNRPLKTNGGGLEKRPPDPFVSETLLEKKNQKKT
jgi:hypothetical protein